MVRGSPRCSRWTIGFRGGYVLANWRSSETGALHIAIWLRQARVGGQEDGRIPPFGDGEGPGTLSAGGVGTHHRPDRVHRAPLGMVHAGEVWAESEPKEKVQPDEKVNLREAISG